MKKSLLFAGALLLSTGVGAQTMTALDLATSLASTDANVSRTGRAYLLGALGGAQVGAFLVQDAAGLASKPLICTGGATIGDLAQAYRDHMAANTLTTGLQASAVVVAAIKARYPCR